MRFDERLKSVSRSQLWKEYCGFLDMDLDGYMYVQRRLMAEQLRYWCASPLGKKLLAGKTPATIDELREMLPLTRYEDYADVLLARRSDMLPCGEPAIWIQTTWEGGLRPIKLAPYTRAMLDCYRKNLIATVMMATAKGKGNFVIKKGYRVLYGGAPLPYATGLQPSLFEEDLHLTWLPDANAGGELSFSQRIKQGFKMAMGGGVDYFFAIGSVANYITESFGKMTGGRRASSGGPRVPISPVTAARYVAAKYYCHRDQRAMLPKDLFRLKAFFYGGTDARHYRDRLTKAWGIVPTEAVLGTESACLGAETWEHEGMYLFPDSCFYEFIPEAEMYASLDDPAYQPQTCLMDGVAAGQSYELVISVLHGGAFMRYRIGDVFRCVSARPGELPRFSYVDRVPDVIDIAGFTRITEASMREVVRLSRLTLGDWVLRKEFDPHDDPFLHLYVEIPPDAQISEAAVQQVLQEHLAVYFKYFDSDYSDLKKLLNMEPLQITILKYGSIAGYERQVGRRLRRINPTALDTAGLLRAAGRPAAERPAAERRVSRP